MPIVAIKNMAQGVVKDVPPEELVPGAWSDSRNVRFSNGLMKRMRGMTQAFTVPTVVPYHLTPLSTPTKRYWVHCGLARVYADDGVTARVDITPTTPFTGGIDDKWTSTVMNGVLVVNNQKDIPHYWGGDPATKLLPLPGWDTTYRAKAMRNIDNKLVAIGITKNGVSYPHMVLWSHVAQPGSVPTSWNIANAAEDAGEQDKGETPDLMVDARLLGDILVVYKERSAYGMAPTFNSQVFRFFRLPGESGALTQNCVVETPKGHVVLTAGDLVLNTGQGAASIADGVVREWLFRMLNPQRATRAFLAASPARNEVWVCFPSIASETCDLALIWNWTDGTFAIRDLRNVTHGATAQVNIESLSLTWGGDIERWKEDGTRWAESEFTASEARLLFCHSTPRISLADVGSTDFGMAFTSYVERAGMTFDDAYSYKYVRGVRPRFSGASGAVLRLQAGGADVSNASPEWSAPVPFTAGVDLRADLEASGRFLALRFTSDDLRPWTIRSCDLDLETIGS